MIEQKNADIRVSPEETRERIILAAREVIKRKGKRGATTREIADVAGVNEATLFRHFGNKEALILAVAKHSCPDVSLRATIEQLDGPIEKDLYVLARDMTAHMESMIDMIRWSLVETDYENSIFTRETWRPQIAIRSVVGDYMASQVKAGSISGSPDDLASVFMAMIFARLISREKFTDNKIFSDTDFGLKYLVDVFLNGVRSK